MLNVIDFFSTVHFLSNCPFTVHFLSNCPFTVHFLSNTDIRVALPESFNIAYISNISQSVHVSMFSFDLPPHRRISTWWLKFSVWFIIFFMIIFLLINVVGFKTTSTVSSIKSYTNIILVPLISEQTHTYLCNSKYMPCTLHVKYPQGKENSWENQHQ